MDRGTRAAELCPNQPSLIAAARDLLTETSCSAKRESCGEPAAPRQALGLPGRQLRVRSAAKTWAASAKYSQSQVEAARGERTRPGHQLCIGPVARAWAVSATCGGGLAESSSPSHPVSAASMATADCRCPTRRPARGSAAQPRAGSARQAARQGASRRPRRPHQRGLVRGRRHARAAHHPWHRPEVASPQRLLGHRRNCSSHSG